MNHSIDPREDKAHFVVVWALGSLVAWVLLILALAFGPAWGHSFYSAHCCDGQDCAPYPHERVTYSPAGYRVIMPDGYQVLVPTGDPRIIPQNHDPDYHLCEYPTGTIRCLYVPEPST